METKGKMSSALPGFFKLPMEQRISKVQEMFDLSPEDIQALSDPEIALNLQTCDSMVENVIARHILPIGVATNFIVDGKEVLIPMATEEPSVIAGASLSAKLCRPSGGFTTASGTNVCTGQIVVVPPSDSINPLKQVNELKDKILEVANSAMPTMVERTGGAHKLDIRSVDTESGTMIIVDIHVQVGDSMGANCVTKACEAVKAFIADELQFEPLMGILTNLSKKRLVFATARWHAADLSTAGFDGFDVARRIVMAANLAKADPTRATTHRKGIMNGVTAVVIATGNDSRAVEADVHTYSTLEGVNRALTSFRIDDNHDLVGDIWIPITVGTVGGSINRSKLAPVARKLMKVETANDLARTMAAVGLAQNFAALRALVTAGISAGHMKLHSRNIASEAGATPEELDLVAQKLIQAGSISVAAAKNVISQMRCNMT